MLAQRLGMVVVAGLALSSVACAGAGGQARQPMGHVEVKRMDSPDDAPEEAKTVQVSYIFDRDVVNKDFDKTFKDGFDKKGIRVDEELNAHAHFGVNKAKITGTVTYVKKSMGRFSILDADLVAEAHYEADLQLDLDVKVKGETKKANAQDWDGTALGGKPFTLVKNVMPTNIPIAGPLFLHAHFDLTAACDLGVEGQMHATTGVGIKGDVRLSARYKKAGFDKADGKHSRFAFEAKTPNFKLAPRPYLRVEGKQQSVKGKCSLQPTAVLLLEHSVGAKLMVEPWIELDASRPSSSSPWKFDAQAGVSVHAATDIELFGRQMRKPKEFNLFEIALTKKGDSMGTSPRLLAPRPGKGRPTTPSNLAPGGPAEDLRVADARPTLNPFAAPDAAGAAGAAPVPSTLENGRPAGENPPTVSDATATASAPATATATATAAATVPASEPAKADAPTTTADVRPAATDARTATADVRPATTDVRPAAVDARSSVFETRPGTAAARPASADARPAGQAVQLVRASLQPDAEVAATEPSAAPAAPEPARKAGRGKKKSGATAAVASTVEPRVPAPSAPSAPAAASATEGLLSAALSSAPTVRKIGRKPGLAALAKAVRKK